MAESGCDHGDRYHDHHHIYTVERIRVFQCNNPHPQDDGLESDFDGVFLFNVQRRVLMGQPGTIYESVQKFDRKLEGVRFCLEALCYLDDNVDGWFEFAEGLVMALGLFKHSDRLAMEISGYLRSFFRFHSGCFDSILIVADVDWLRFSPEHLEDKEKQFDHDHHHDDDDDVMMIVDDEDEGMVDEDMKEMPRVEGILVDEMEKILRLAKWRWGEEGRDMELVEVEPRMTVKNMDVMAVGAEQEGCSICLSALAGKVARHSQLRWLPESHESETVRLTCGHMFHHQCIFNWLPINHSCPYCRSSSLTIV